jgi:hypothetical protein
MSTLKTIILFIGLTGFAIALFCQMMLRQHISEEKVRNNPDLKLNPHDVIPPLELLNDTGLNYFRGLKIGGGIFMASVILNMVLFYLTQ